MEKFKEWIRSQAVLVVAAVAAGISLFFVPPSREYLYYSNYRVLTLLFCLMLVVSGLEKIGVFAALGQKMITGAHNTRFLCLTLVLLCFFSSMLITNDVALLTFVPFAILILALTGQKKNMIYVIVLQTVAANLGSMLTPVGNPQNLYLYTTYSFTPSAFFRLTVPITVLSLFLLLALSFGVRAEHITVTFEQEVRITDRPRLVLYTGLFFLCLLCVFQVLPYPILLIVLAAVMFFADRSLFRKVDYGLLFTFVCFFVFVGNMERIEAVRGLLEQLVQGRVKLAGVLLSQVISNVPSAVLLSGFTDKGADLLIGVNIGGLGTLVASLASLISYKLYAKTEEAHTGRYLAVFSAVNIGILLILMIVFG